MEILLVAEMDRNSLAVDATAKALSAARLLGGVTALVAGCRCSAAAEAVARLHGVSKVLVADDEAYENALAEPLADLIVSISANFSHIFAAATANAKNVFPRVAALLDVMILSDVTTVVDEETFERPIYAGNAIQTVKSSDRIKVVTIRTASFSAASEKAANSPIEGLPARASPPLSWWIEDKVDQSERPELTSAGTVISGGRGIGSQEGFRLIEALADKLGAAVGASRAAVDAGFAPNDWQVGQTGKIVSPDLYIAIGISGAIQHLAGMKDSKIIVAINKDENAPIFQMADFGLRADLFSAVPELIAKL